MTLTPCCVPQPRSSPQSRMLRNHGGVRDELVIILPWNSWFTVRVSYFISGSCVSFRDAKFGNQSGVSWSEDGRTEAYLFIFTSCTASCMWLIFVFEFCPYLELFLNPHWTGIRSQWVFERRMLTNRLRLQTSTIDPELLCAAEAFKRGDSKETRNSIFVVTFYVCLLVRSLQLSLKYAGRRCAGEKKRAWSPDRRFIV